MDSRIAFFLPSLHGGGAERAISNLAVGVAARGQPVDLVLAKAVGPFLRGLADSVRIVDLGSSRVLRSLPKLIRYLRQVRPEVLFSAMDHANLVALVAAMLAGSHTRVFVSVRTTVSVSLGKNGGGKSRVVLLLMRILYRWADGIVCNSRGVAQDLVKSTGLPEKKVFLLYNAVVDANLEERAGMEPEAPGLLDDSIPTILSVGRLTRAKDYPSLIRAFAILRQRRRVRLLILGEGEERPRLEALVRELGVKADVAMPGFVQNPYAYMSRAAVFVLSSSWEGLPCALIEAMACGCPVVSTDCRSGPAEILEDGRYGLLVPVGDAPALAEALEKALASPLSRQLLQARAARFAVDDIVSEFLELIKPPSLVLLAANSAWSVMNFRSGLLRALQQSGYRLAVVAPADPSVGRLPCEFIPIRLVRGGTNPFGDLRLLRDLRRIYRRLRPEAVLHFTSKMNIYGTIACSRLGIPSIANITGLGSAFLAGGMLAAILRNLYRFALRKAASVFFQNPEDRHYFIIRGLVPEGLSGLLPGSGVDLQHFAPRSREPSTSFVFLFSGRLLKDKGIREYAEAARILKNENSTVLFRITGDIDESNPSAIRRQELMKWKNEGSIEYLGQLSDIRPAIAAADCVVLPSYREGAPRTLLEAASMARPLIAADVPGCRQVVEHGRNGFLCKARNVEDLADKMRAMLKLPEADRRRMGNEGRAKVQREFDEAIVVRAYLEVLEKLGIVAKDNRRG